MRIASMRAVTIRNLSDEAKLELRKQAAARGISMEQYLRDLVQAATADPQRARAASARARSPVASRRPWPYQPTFRFASTSRPSSWCLDPLRQAHPAHHRRRHRRLQVARPDPPAARARRFGPLRHDGGGAGVRHAACRSARSPPTTSSPSFSTARTSTMSAISACRARPISSSSRQPPPT